MNQFLPRPAIAPAAVWAFPAPRRGRLSNGIELMTFELPGQHVISAHLVLDLPLNAERADIEGVATICARTLDEGTLRHNGEEFAELLETEGAGFGVDLSLSGIQLVLDVPASHLDRALELFAEAVTEPSLADRDVNRHVQLRLAEIEQAQANSAHAASIAFRAAVFDETKRASRMNGGEPETVRDVTQEAVAAFHRDHFGPAGATLVLAGDFVDDPIAAAERSLGSWRNDEQRRVMIEEPTPGTAPHPVDRPARCGAGGHPVRRLRHRSPGSAMGRDQRRLVRDGRRVPVSAQRGASGGEGLHLRRTDELRPAAYRRIFRSSRLFPYRGCCRRAGHHPRVDHR